MRNTTIWRKSDPMKLTKLTHLVYGLIATLAVVLLAASAADAASCKSGCNQVRRGCRAEANYTRRVAFDTCDDTRRDCMGACSDTATACNDLCVEDDAECAAACDMAKSDCRDGCSIDRDDCRAAAKLVRSDAFVACQEGRGSCREVCDAASDRGCVRACAKAGGACFAEVGVTHEACQLACETADDLQACSTLCKVERLAAHAACSAGRAACVDGCNPKTTTTLAP